VIDFNDWSIEQAMKYSDVFTIIDKQVRPERQRTKPDGSYVLRKPLPNRWWQYADKRPALRKAIADLDRVLVIALVSKAGLPVWAPTDQVFSHKLGVFATDRSGYLSLLSSTLHSSWAWKQSSTLETRLNYSPSDAFETFPLPELTERMDRVGEELQSFRRSVMLGRQLGLTKLYNLVHDPAVTDEDVRRLREIHTEIDYVTAQAYGWEDLDLGHGFHDTRQGRRFTIAPEVQVEVLDRLLEFNHERYAEEIRQGLHAKKKPKRTKNTIGCPVFDGRAEPEDILF
jgi:hypothetical protein